MSLSTNLPEAYRGYLIHENIINRACWITKEGFTIAHAGGYHEAEAIIDLLLDDTLDSKDSSI